MRCASPFRPASGADTLSLALNGLDFDRHGPRAVRYTSIGAATPNASFPASGPVAGGSYVRVLGGGFVNSSAGGHSDGGFKFYGMGTFSLDWSIGDGEGYGHVGDTYGYQSQTTFFPAHDFVLTVATNVETTSQAQPADATCVGYHAVLAAMQGTPPPTCTFNVPHHFIGTCNCTSASAA